MAKVTKGTGRILALDFGEKRIGVAITDESKMISQPLKSVEIEKKESKSEIKKIINEENVSQIVLGRPRNADGSLGFQYERTLKFKELISDLGVPIVWEDETGTSLEAEKRLKEKGLSQAEIKKRIDSEAAAIILEGYLEKIKDSFGYAQDRQK